MIIDKNKRFAKTEETMKEAIEILNIEGKCLIVRPTGFGKSYILSHIAPLYDHVIYIYPRNIIQLDVKRKYQAVIKGLDIHFVSYSMMVSLMKKKQIGSEEIEIFTNFTNNERSLIILDEVHLAGGNKVSRALDKLIETYPNAHLLGATATPIRSDDFNIRTHFFDSCEVSRYSLNNAIQDGTFVKPYYIYGTFLASENFLKLTNKVKESNMSDERKSKIIKMINSSEMKYAELNNEKEVIKSAIKLAEHDEKYLKFILFFPNIDTMYMKKESVEKNFEEMYPGYKIRSMIVASDTTENKKNIKKLQTLKRRNKTIDLVFSIDMLSMGYHVPDINGIIMYRMTCSDIIYVQQIGRCMSVDSELRPIIFDFVGNYFDHKGSFYGDTVLDSKYGNSKKYENDFDTGSVEIIDNMKEFNEIERLIEIEEQHEVEEMWIKAHLYKNAPLDICCRYTRLDRDEFLYKVKNWKETINSNEEKGGD